LRLTDGIATQFTYSASSTIVSVLLDGAEHVEFTRYSGRSGLPPEFSYAPAPPRDASGRLRLVGSPDEVAADISAYSQPGVKSLTLRFARPGNAGRAQVGADGIDVDDFIQLLQRFVDYVAPGLG
jgi:hypothetical protein